MSYLILERDEVIFPETDSIYMCTHISVSIYIGALNRHLV